MKNNTEMHVLSDFPKGNAGGKGRGAQEHQLSGKSKALLALCFPHGAL